MACLRVGSLLVVGVACAWLAGCDAPLQVEPRAHWAPSSAARFVTIGRSTSYALAHEAGRDLLIVEDPVVADEAGGVAGRLTWIVSIDSEAELEMELSVEGSRGWLLEEIDGRPSHAAPALGTVVLHERDAERVSATLALRAAGAGPSAGVAGREAIEVRGRFEFGRASPHTPQYQEMRTRRGAR